MFPQTVSKTHIDTRAPSRSNELWQDLPAPLPCNGLVTTPCCQCGQILVLADEISC